MSRKSLTLIGGTVLLIVLICVIVFSDKLIPKKASESTPTPAAEITLAKFDKEKLTKIEVTNPSGQMTFTQKDKKWSVAGKPDFPLEQSKVDSMAGALANFTADSIVEEKASLSELGLDKPQATVKVTDEANPKTILIGGKVPISGNYFVKVEGDDRIFSVSEYKVTDLLSDLMAFHAAVNFSLEFDKIVSFAILKDNKPSLQIQTKTVQGKSMEDKEMTVPYQSSLNSDAFTKIIGDPIKKLSAKQIIAEGGDLTPYGLKNPLYKLAVKDEKGQTLNLLLGTLKDDSRYAQVEGSKTVFTISNDALTYLEVDPSTLRSKFLMLPFIDDVNLISVLSGERKFEFAIKREGDKATYTINGKEASEEKFKAAYQEVIGLTAENYRNQTVTGDPIGNIVYTMKDGSKQSLAFYRVDERSLQVMKNGVVTEEYILTERFNAMLTALEKFEKEPK